MRFLSLPSARKKLGPQGWTDVADQAMPWTATVTARWRSPSFDWFDLAATGYLLLVGALAFLDGVDRGGALMLVALGIGGWGLFRAVRQVTALMGRSDFTLVLSPDRLTLSSSSPSQPPLVVLRERASWLTEAEASTDWHARTLCMTDVDDEQIACFSGGMAEVEVTGRGQPSAEEVPSRVPAAVLLGQWWPHQSRRVGVVGSMGLQTHWRDPDPRAYPRRELREQMVWSAIYGILIAFGLIVALDESFGDVLRIAAATSAAFVLIWRLRVLARAATLWMATRRRRTS